MTRGFEKRAASSKCTSERRALRAHFHPLSQYYIRDIRDASFFIVCYRQSIERGYPMTCIPWHAYYLQTFMFSAVRGYGFVEHRWRTWTMRRAGRQLCLQTGHAFHIFPGTNSMQLFCSCLFRLELWKVLKSWLETWGNDSSMHFWNVMIHSSKHCWSQHQNSWLFFGRRNMIACFLSSWGRKTIPKPIGQVYQGKYPDAPEYPSADVQILAM